MSTNGREWNSHWTSLTHSLKIGEGRIEWEIPLIIHTFRKHFVDKENGRLEAAGTTVFHKRSKSTLTDPDFLMRILPCLEFIYIPHWS